ncbi:TonB-dependent receptor [Bizionia gelidisalsuginis]|uniref:TonB-dependent receptor n=1 Tax=Bizionia gelidisalsuginis TaxID=291188 RepID=A0ABY3M9R5_9FLAO|nr:carboxypeptidase-like regulatory domain-containing protein [Bizionia gelidisalsuginis]TYC12011.1 TonB-dependent receptor [Bizionia gelidisalsuginis]
MKKTILLYFALFSICLLNAQSEYVTVSFNNANTVEALTQLEEQSSLKFYFVDRWFDSNKITKTYENKSVQFILSDLFSQSSINFLVYDNKVILTNNSVVYKTLPDDFFKTKEQSYYPKNDAIFFNQYDSKNVITVGKQNVNLNSQEFTISGRVTDTNTGKPIDGLIIIFPNTNRQITTDKNGRYSATVTSGLNTIETKLFGYQEERLNILVYGNGTVNFKVSEAAEKLDEVVIDSKKNDNIKEAIVGITRIDIAGLKNIPVVLGERDILKIATTLPGIKTAGEGSAGFNVRGGRADQNLILLDDAVIYSPSHFLGFFSAVNPFATGSVDIYKASIPAEYGGRLSSVFDIKTKEPNYEKFSGEGSIGPVTGSLSLQTPIVKDKISLTTAVRATYSDWILKSLDDESLKNSEASFYDGLIKYDHKINENNKFQATGYYSKDRFSITSDSIFSYNNALASLKWNHSFNDKHKAEVIAVNSQYKYGIEYEGRSNSNFDFDYKINETQLKLKMKYLHSDKHKFTYGASTKLYQIEPGNLSAKGSESIIESKRLNKERGLESAVFLSDKFEVNKKLLFDVGLRYSVFSALGANTQNVYEDNVPKNESTITEVIEYGDNETIETYGGAEFRLSMRYLLTPSLSVKASFNKTIQYLHLLSNNTTISPTDTWKLSDLNTKPQEAYQYSVGLYKNFDQSAIEVSVEGYYKKMNNILDYKVGAELILNETIEQELLQGEGKAYGVEFLIKKENGNLNGWIGYSYSKALLKLQNEIPQEQVNNGEYFPANYDKPHDFSMVLNYKLTKKYSFSANFIYQTGRPITYPIGKYNFAGSEQVLYSDRNQFRIPDYYRLDVGFNIEGSHKLKKLAHSFWNISVYNVLGRNNPYSVFFVNDQGKVKAYQSSIFSIPVPTVSYNFKF